MKTPEEIEIIAKRKYPYHQEVITIACEKMGFVNGYTKCQKTHKFTEVDIRNAIVWALGLGRPIDDDDFEYRDTLVEQYLESITI